MIVFRTLVCLSSLAVEACAAGAATSARESFEATVLPFVEKNCQKCHNQKLQSGEVNFDDLKTADSLTKQRAIWQGVVYVLKMGQMPPPGTPRPQQNETEDMVAFLNREFARLDREKFLAARGAPQPPTRDWLTWNGDAERTGWAQAESKLSKQNAGKLDLLWKSQLDAAVTRTNSYSTLTDPLVVTGVATKQGPKTLVYIASGENNVYALDADTGAVFWERKFLNETKPPQPASGMCPNNLNATPVIDKKSGIIYVLANDGKLRGLGLADGDDRMPPTAFVEPFSRNWSLNLANGYVYTSSSRGCGGAMSVISGVEVSNPNRPVVRFYPSTGKASGPWGRGGIVSGPGGMLAQTADGAYDPASGRFGNTILGLTKDLRLIDSFTPANWDYLNRKDLDLGAASPVVFPFEKWTLAAVAAKEGVIYLLDAMDLGGPNHQTPLYTSPRYGNDAVIFGYTGVWGAMSTFVDAQGDRWLLVPMEGPPAKDTVADFKTSDGAVVNGCIMAFQVKMRNDKPTLVPMWMSHDLDLPGMPVTANGVVYVLANGDRARDKFRTFRPGGGAPVASSPSAAGGPPSGRGGPGGGPPRRRAIRTPGFGPVNEINPGEPGSERDAAWRAGQDGPDGQMPGRRFSGGQDLTHAVLFALDPATGKVIYSSQELIDSWNHYGALALSDGRVYVSTYDARVYAFGLN